MTVPYSAIIKTIPQELWGKLAPAGVAGYNYTISRRSVLEQIPSGSVKVSFGELRHGAPNGVFISTAAEDSRQVDLPLVEILAQLHPDTFARRPDQGRVAISDEVPDLFGAKGERLGVRVLEKKEVATSMFTRQNVSAAGAMRPAPAAPVAPIAPFVPNVPPVGNVVPLPGVSAAPPAPLRMPVMPPATAAARPVAPIAFPVPKPAVAGPAPMPRPLPTGGMPRPVAATLSHAEPSHPAPAAAGFSGSMFFIGLDAVAENWPDGVRQELAQLKIPDAKVALPAVEICEGLKRGRIQYPWRILRSWIQPTPIYATPSPHDDQVLELPLKSLTPLFLDYIRANPVNRQGADAENITEFFRKAEHASGTSPELLQPLFQQAPPASAAAPAGYVVPAPVAAPVTPPPAPMAPPAPPAVEPPAAPASSFPAELGIENDCLCAPVPMLSAGWPEPVLRDVAQFGLAGARFEIPVGQLEPGLKSGRLEFSWRELCGWLNPPSKPAQVSINGETRVALPLGLIAPLFMKHRGSGQGKRKASVAESIPDLFSAAGKPLPAPAPAPAPAHTHAHAAAPARDPAPAAPASTPPPMPAPAPASGQRKGASNLSELFGEPEKKSWTPNEIVQRTTRLPNVAGALIALQDGLLVASNMPSALKTETIAAFVPQIFGRLNQYSKELQMGETSAVGFTVSAGTVQVYNAGIIYFAVLGKTGTLLPYTDLQLIAAELSRHTK